MTVLIATVNQDLIQSIYPQKKFNFERCSENTSIIRIHKKTFLKLYESAVLHGLNPFGLFLIFP